MGQYTRLAIVNSTHGGEKLTVGGTEIGGEGQDGRKQYVIALHNNGGYMTCSCPAFIYQPWRKMGLTQPKPCKHILAYLAQKSGIPVSNGGNIRKG